MLFVLCVVLLLFVEGLFFFSRFVHFVVLFLCLVDPVRHCVILFGKTQLIALLSSID